MIALLLAENAADGFDFPNFEVELELLFPSMR